MIELISIVISIVSAIAWLVTQFNTISSLKKSNEELHERVLDLEQKRNEDVLGFTKVLGEFNVTLSRFDETLKNVNATLREVKDSVKTHDDDIRQLLINTRNGPPANNRNNS